MKARDKRQSIAEETLDIIEKGYFISPSGESISIQSAQENAEESTICYSPAQSDDLLEKPIEEKGACQIEVSAETTLNAVRRLIDQGESNVLCLNFASARNAGGGFLGGSQAQEESIARATGLYPCLLKAEDYYKSNRAVKSCFYTDYMIYSPAVPIFKNEAGVNEESLKLCAVITAPAVNTGVVKQREPNRIPEIETVMKRRIDKVLSIAYHQGHQSIVLGAWGCGVFQNDPVTIAAYFKEIIDKKYKFAFKRIVFGIYASKERFIIPFQQEFEA